MDDDIFDFKCADLAMAPALSVETRMMDVCLFRCTSEAKESFLIASANSDGLLRVCDL